MVGRRVHSGFRVRHHVRTNDPSALLKMRSHERPKVHYLDDDPSKGVADGGTRAALGSLAAIRFLLLSMAAKFQLCAVDW
jgi:hypothetical protein